MSDTDTDTLYSVRSVRDFRKRLVDMEADIKQDRRLAEGTCHVCFYLRGGGIVGQGFTQYVCRSCCEEHMHPNTAAPKLCAACGKKEGRCRKCQALISAVAAEVAHPTKR
jgi:hypothetical protein